MKRTTYIMIGIFFSGLLVMAGFLFWLAFSEERMNRGMIFTGETVSMDVPSFRAVDVVMLMGNDTQGLFQVKDVTNLMIVPATDGENRFSFPKDLGKYLTANVTNDTLHVIIDFSELLQTQKRKDVRWIATEGLNMSLTVDSAFTDLRSRARDWKICLKDIKTDSMNLNSFSDLEVELCNLRSLRVDSAGSLILNKSDVDNLYLNLDALSGCKISGCRIDTEYLTGRRQHYHDIGKGQFRRTLWNPQCKDASLQLIIGDTADIFF